MSTLRVSLFANVEIAHDNRSPATPVTRTLQVLLAYLMLYRHRTHPREVLAGLLWGDHSESRARSCLSTALWRLRRILEPEGISRGTYLLTTPTGEVGFNRESDHWLDVAVFEERVDPVLAKPIHVLETADVREAESALQLYTGELLEGFYDDWALRERERLRLLYLNTLARLMRYYTHHGAYEQGLVYGQQILSLDPLREEIHREMMRLYLASGQRALAVRQYEACCEILAAELGISPMEETRALYAQIVPEKGRDHARATVGGGTTELQQALQQLRHAMQALDETRVQLQHVLSLVEGLVETRKRAV